MRRAPKSFWAHVVLGWAYQQKRMHREALAELQQAVTLTGGKVALGLAAYAQARAAAGDRAAALDLLSKLLERARTGYVSAYEIALVYAALGRPDDAFAWLETARQERSSFLPYITWDRRADVLRADPRYAALMRQMGLPVK